MVPDTMQAAVFDEAGAPEQVLQVRTVAVPQPQAGEVLVKIEASPVQPADGMFIGGRYRIKAQFPQVAGLEGCGTVVACGAGVDLPVGTRVAFRHPGCWAEYAVVPTAKLSRVPQGVSVEDACQFSLNPITAWALLDECGAQSGDWIAMNAAASTVSGLVRALAARRGIRVVGIHRSDAPQGDVSSGAEDLGAALLAATGGAPLAALLDCIGGQSVMRVLPAMKTGGVIVSYGVLEREPAPMANADLIYRNLTWKGFGVDHWLARNAPQVAAMGQGLWSAIRDGALPLPVRSRHALADVRQAFATPAGGGKTLLMPSR
jgi:NADPH:quinone reductase-like Zn-dependent oxidoreductase